MPLPRLQLYQFAASGNCRIVRLVLAEKQLACERVNIDLTRGDNRSTEFLKLNPRGKVPVLVDRGSAEPPAIICESSVINEYLEEAFPSPALMPAQAPARALVRQLVHLFDTELAPSAGPLIIECLLKPKPQQRPEFIAERQQACRQLLARLVQMAPLGPYLAGAYSLADASYTPVLSVLGLCGIELAQEFPQLAVWLAEVKRRPSYAASEQ